MNWSGFDVRVCWPSSSEPLDTEDWRLGPAPAAVVLAEGDNCAMVIRDLEVTPIPQDAADGALPAGWGVFEGTVPGVGHVRAFEPSEFRFSMVVPSSGAWLAGGGAISRVAGVESSSSLRFSSTGVALGREPYVQFFDGVGDETGAGLWVSAAIQEFPDEHCADPCDPTGFPALVLAGPNPQVFEVRDYNLVNVTPMQSGGVLLGGGNFPDSDFVGVVHARTDGTRVEITLPEEFAETVLTVRDSGEVCGSGRDTTGASIIDLVWCAQSDGSSPRYGRVQSGTFRNDLFLLDDDTAISRDGGAVWRLDLETLIASPYLDAGVVSDLRVGADGVVYGKYGVPGSAESYGAFLPAGFVPIADIYDFAPLSVEEAEVTSLLVTEDVVFAAVGRHNVRIPRSRWNVEVSDSGDECDGAPELRCWPDADGDGFALADAVPMSACTCPDGTTSVEPAGSEIDCADNDDRAFPGQTMYFADRIPDVGRGRSWDFDCNGTEEGQWGVAVCEEDTSGMMTCTTTDGFSGFAPCGATQAFQGCPDPNQPTMCGGSCAYDPILMFCAQGTSTLMWTQTCR